MHHGASLLLGVAKPPKCRDARSVRPYIIFDSQFITRTHEPCVPTMLAKIVGPAMFILLFLWPTYMGQWVNGYVVTIKNQLRGCVVFKNLCNLAGADRNA